MTTRVVLAEDDQDIRELVTLILEGEGFTTVAVDDGAAALAACRAEPPTLALLDVNMPGDMDGLTLTHALREDPATQGLPILLLTALGQQADVERGLAAGADGYIVKPFDPEDLLRRIDELLPGR